MSTKNWSSRLQLPEIESARTTLARDGFVNAAGFLPDDIADRAAALASEVVDRHAAPIQRTSEATNLDYEVVTGDLIQVHAPALFELFVSERMVGWVRAVSGVESVAPSTHLKSAININCLSRKGQGYPWHNDAVPYTVVLFLTTLPPSAGGTLLIGSLQQELVSIRPVRGDLVLMDGSRCRHSIAPLRQHVRRLSIPMVYPVTTLDRPSGLDDYLYKPAHRKAPTSPR